MLNRYAQSKPRKSFITLKLKSSKAAGDRFRNKRIHAVTVMQKLLESSENINISKS